MITQDIPKLDQQTVQYLSEILVHENTTGDELIKSLIRDRWMSLQNEMPPLPKRKNNKQMIAEFLRKKSTQPINRASDLSR
ncbi:MAG TPA: hypothetical protein V6C84_11860 [Coleofasciculaceae cyanobacterium]|jgi:hypothetical protein